MSTAPDYMYRMSEALSEVMDDIGVNEKLVMEKTKSCFLQEALTNLTDPLYAKHLTAYIFGSQIEGSTTIGLHPDQDILYSQDAVNVIQRMLERKPGSGFSVMMIQNENISPGYCYLQFIRSDLPFPAPADDLEIYGNDVIDSEGRLLLLNTWTIGNIPKNSPALAQKGIPGVLDIDIVPGFSCKSSPLQATSMLQNLKESKWPPEDDKTFCRNAGCFVVSAGGKLSDMPKLEWRISTSLQERCLMLSLNITQLRCYVLMKMILKTHINPYVEDVLSSFMCKNVLLYCVYNSSHESSQEWHTGNLLSYLHLCLFMLKECILQRNCPHLMIPENNLLAGRMTDTQRGQLLDIIDNLMEDKEELLYKIQIDDLCTRWKMKLNKIQIDDPGTRLKMMLKIIPFVPKLLPAALIDSYISCNIAFKQSDFVQIFLTKMYNENLEVTQQNMTEFLSDLEKKRDKDDSIQQTACDLVLPLVKSALGSVMACINIDAQAAISDKALKYLEAGKESDVLSGRLKLVSVLYCTGYIEKAESELKISQQLCKMSKIVSLSCCFPRKLMLIYHGVAIKFRIAFCNRFLNNEINCVPHELRYEILKSYIEEDRKMRTLQDSEWMDFIAVDSIPYLYFLQYKTYGLLHRRKKQREALSNLAWNVGLEPWLNHHETALNLIGQCFEQENKQAVAFQCYIWSLQHRKRNNAAKFLLCIQLFKHWKKYNV